MPVKSDKRYTRIDFSSFGSIRPRLKAGSPGPEEDSVYDRAVSKHEAVGDRFANGDHLAYHAPVDSTTGLKHLKLVDAADLGVRPHELIRTQHITPWNTYEKLGELRLGVEDWVTVAQRKQPLAGASDSLSNLVTVRKYCSSDAHGKLQKLRQIRHTNIVSVREIFAFEGNSLLNEIRLAATLAQILNGLAYLATKGFEHGSLTCASIILNSYGEVKIKGQEEFNSYQPAELRDVRALKGVTMDLMQGYQKEDGLVGVDDVHRWPLDSYAVDFLARTTSTESISRLMELPWKKDMLVGLAFFATIEARIGRRYPQD